MKLSVLEHLALSSGPVRKVVDVGAGFPQSSTIATYVARDDVQVTLYEPNPRAAAALRKWIAPHEHNVVIECAIGRHGGDVDLLVPTGDDGRELSAHLRGIRAPSIVNDGTPDEDKEVRVVRQRLWWHEDPGDIDVLNLDMEGAEWYVLAALGSRPKLISVELGDACHPYRNPHEREILLWMELNGYQCEATEDRDWIFGRRITLET